jgi:hypothetical protein
MQNAAGGDASAQFDGRNESYRAIASDLIALIGRVQEIMKLVEAAIASELPAGDQDLTANVVVLDDVTPRYSRALAALTASNASLGHALHFLQDTRTARQAFDGPDQDARRLFRKVSRA